MLSTFLNFHCNIAIMEKILCQPDSWEVSPTQLLYDKVSVEKYFSYMNWVITSNFIVLYAFVFTWILVFKETFSQLILQRRELLPFLHHSWLRIFLLLQFTLLNFNFFHNLLILLPPLLLMLLSLLLLLLLLLLVTHWEDLLVCCCGGGGVGDLL